MIGDFENELARDLAAILEKKFPDLAGKWSPPTFIDKQANKIRITFSNVKEVSKNRKILKDFMPKALKTWLPELEDLLEKYDVIHDVHNDKLSIILYFKKEVKESTSYLKVDPEKLVETFLKESLKSEETQIFKDLIGKIPNSSIIDDYEIRMAANGDLTVSRQGTPIGRKKKGEWETDYPETFKLFKK